MAPALTLSMIGDFATTLLFLFIFVGPVEELIFRGYFQSRLNEAFGRPYRFFGVSYGVGIFVSALLFGLWHMLGVFNPLAGMYYFDLPWGLWIFFNGLVFGFIREKTGNITAPSIVHGASNFFLSIMSYL
jgi:membrane protease YdiL (CAAX protease family)